MSRHERDVVAERPEFFVYGAHEIGVVAARKISSPDRSREQDVADQREPVFPAEEHHVTRRVARTVINLHDFLAELHGVAFFKPSLRRERLCFAEAEALALLGQLVDPKRVFLVRSVNHYAIVVSNCLGTAAMIEMAMREQHFLDGYVEFGNGPDDPVNVSARIHDRRAPGCLAHDD